MAVKLEEGKFYVTRDGRKVGPMFNEYGFWNARGGANGTPGHFTSDGLSAFRGELPRHEGREEHDLVAEWVDPATEPKFKVGDRVVCVDDAGGLLEEGKVYVVEDVDDEYLTVDGGKGMYRYRFKPWTPPVAAEAQPAGTELKFKVGDRVVLSSDNDGYGNKGDEGVVRDNSDYDCRVDFLTGKHSGDYWWVPHDRLKLAESPADTPELKSHLTVAIDASNLHEELDAIIGKLKKIRKLQRELGLSAA